MSARVAVIGCGWWSTYAHLPALERDERAKTIALVDPDTQRLKAAQERFGVAHGFADAESMFDALELDAVVIAVPHAAHYPVAKLALERGVHVLLEKPMVLEPEHATELVALAKKRQRELLIDYPWHYNAQARMVKQALADGKIGTVEFVSCLFASIVRELYAGRPESYRDEFGYPLAAPGESTYSDATVSGGGQGQTQVTHAAALLLWMTGLAPERVVALTENFELSVDLADAVGIHFAGGPLATLASTGSVNPGHDELLEYRIFGSDGHLLFDVNRGEVVFHTAAGIDRLPELPLEQRYPEAAPVQNLVGIALGTDENQSPGTLGAQVVSVVDAMYRSATAGEAIALGAPDREVV